MLARRVASLAICGALINCVRIAAAADESARSQPAGVSAPKVREFTFHYRFQVKGLLQRPEPNRNVVRLWVPHPTSSECQTVTLLTAAAPDRFSEHEEPDFGNKILFLETVIPENGAFAVDLPYRVTRHEVLMTAPRTKADNSFDEKQRQLFLRADELVPKSGKPLALLRDVKLSTDRLKLARQLYDVVDEHVAYRKEGTGWGRGDTNWVCDSGYGNCTDFHSLFISLARSQGLPARFEIGFSIPTDKPAGPVTGYHCWAWFYLDDHGWMPVDISEADKLLN